MASLFAGAALLCATLALFGWFLDRRWLMGFGFAVRIWPLTAIGFIALSGVFLALLWGRRRLALALALLVTGIAGMALLETLAGLELGSGSWFFADRLGEPAIARTPGRPPAHVAVEWLLLSSALFLAGQRSGKRCELACILASVPLGLATMSAGLLLLGTDLNADAAYYLGTSMPSALATVLIALGICYWCYGVGWGAALSAGPAASRTFIMVLPLILLLPALMALFEMVMGSLGVASHFLVEAASGIASVLIVGGLLLWSLRRLATQQATVSEMTRALDSAPIALVGLDGVVLHWSRGCERLYGWSADQALGAGKYRLLKTKPEDAHRPLADLERGQALDRELIDTTQDGREIRALEHAHRIDEGEGAPTIVLSMIDVSAKAAMEAELAASRDRLADAVETYGLAIFEWDARTGTVSWAPGSEARLGLAPGAIRDFESWRENVDPEDAARVLATLEESATRGQETFAFRFHFRRGTPDERLLEGTGRLYYDDQAQLGQVVGVAYDATEREARAARLEAQTAQLRTMLDTVPDPIIVIDEDGVILRIGASTVRTLGYEPDDVVGKEYLIFAPDRLRQNYADALRQYVETGRPRFIGQVTRSFARRADGVEIPVEIMVGEAVAGGTRLFTLLMRDITERLEYESRLSALASELAHVSRLSAMGEMAAGIAHELNQPLTAVANYLAAAGLLLREGKAEPDKLRELVETAGRQTQRAGQIIRRMRNFASKGQVDVQAEPVRETIREAVSLVFVGPMPAEFSIRYDIHPEAQTILVDRIQLQQVLVNLLRNAVQAIQRGAGDNKEIEISARPDGKGMVEMTVSDRGPGMPEMILSGLFEPFRSAGGEGGMGVGLSICRRIIEAHGGQIWAENRKQGGAAFHFTVPGLTAREAEVA